MTLQITVNSLSGLERLSKELKVMDIQFMQFQAITLRKLANIIILETIHNRMEARGFSRKIIDHTYINNIEVQSKTKMRIFITSDYVDPDTGFDVSLGREEGTDKVFVKSDEPTTDRPNPSMKFIINGKAGYSKGHWRDGVISFFIIRDTIRDMKDSLQDEYSRAIQNWFIVNLGGDVKVAS